MSAWLLEVLDAALPELTGGRRDALAAAILDAIPARLVAAAIASTTRKVLEEEHAIAPAGEIADGIGKRAAVALITALQASVVFPADQEGWAFCASEDCAWAGEEAQLRLGEGPEQLAHCPKCDSTELLFEGVRDAVEAVEASHGTP